MDGKSEQKRTRERILTSFKITYQKHFYGGVVVEPVVAISRNVTRDGLYLETSELLSVGDVLNIKFNFPLDKQDYIFSASVVWVKQIKENRRYAAGVKFEKIENKCLLENLKKIELMNIFKVLEEAVKANATDVHLVCDQPVILRVDGKLKKIDSRDLDKKDIKAMIYNILTYSQMSQFEKDKEIEFSLAIPSGVRYRVNVHMQNSSVEAVFHKISCHTKSMEELGVPGVVKKLARLDGLLILTGPSGSGKSTTLGSIVRYINDTQEQLIITLEEPVECVYKNNKSIVKQREIGVDTGSFLDALRQVLHQDPNVIVATAVKDYNCANEIFKAAKSKKLVIVCIEAFSTSDALMTLINMFPDFMKHQAALELSMVLRAVINNTLLPQKDSFKNILAVEVITANNELRNLIRAQDFEGVCKLIQKKDSDFCVMEDAIEELYKSGKITKETALIYSSKNKV